MQEQTTDLFGEVRVTTLDVEAWMRAVPRIDPNSPRGKNYITAYSVVEKIKRAKLEGRFEHVVAPRVPGVGPWWERFNWVRPVG